MLPAGFMDPFQMERKGRGGGREWEEGQKRIRDRDIGLSRVERPTKHTIGHIGAGFYGSNDPTNSVKAVKEVPVLRIRLQYH